MCVFGGKKRGGGGGGGAKGSGNQVKGMLTILKKYKSEAKHEIGPYCSFSFTGKFYFVTYVALFDE